MSIKKILKNYDSWLTVVIVIGLLLVINFLSYSVFYRFDLTQNKDFSISEVSKKSAESLDDILNVKIYFSKELPSQYASLKQEVGDILEEYSNYSDNKIKTEFIDPAGIENSEQEMYMLGIPALQFNVLEKDKYQVVKGYLGMIIQYGNKKEVIPVIENTENLEYQVTTAIKKVTSQEIGTIGLLQDHGCYDLEKDISLAYQKLQELYDVENIDLSKTTEIPASIDTLLVLSPKDEFKESELKAIDSFLMRGGSLLLALNNVSVEQGLQVKTIDTKISSLLEKYGLKISNNLVLDYSSAMASFNSGFFTFSTNYPFWPKIAKQGFDQENAAVAKLESLVLPWVSSLELDKDKIDSANKISLLAKTTNQAWSQADNFDLNPQQNFSPSGSQGEKILAASVFGKFKSAYSDKSVDSARIILVGDADFVHNNFVNQFPDNMIFFQNLVDSLSLDEDLINIRSKSVLERPIKELSDSEKMVMKFINIFAVTIVVVIFGLLRYFLRRKSRFVDEL